MDDNPKRVAGGNVGSRRTNVMVGVAFLAVTAVGLLGTSFAEAPTPGSDPGPKSYPYFVLVLMALCSVLVLLERPRQPPLADPEAAPPDNRTAILAAVALLLYVILLEPLGYVLSSALFVAGALLLARERRWYVVLVYALVIPLGVYLLFSSALSIALPTGVVEKFL